MKRLFNGKISTLSWMILLMAGISYSCGNYQSLKTEFDNYKPPILTEFASVSSEKERRPADGGIQADDFEIQKRQIREMRIMAEKSLLDTQNESVFYKPDSQGLKMLSDAMTNDDSAEAVLKDNFDLTRLEILAWGRNLMVKAAEKDVRASLEGYNQISNLDDILRQYSAFTAAVMTGVGNMEDMESITKKFPFPGLLSLKGSIVRQDVQIAVQDLEIARRTAVTQARTAFWDLVYNDRAKEITRQTLELLNTLELSAAKRYETVQSSFLELTKAQIQKEKMKVELFSLIEERKNIEAIIRSLLNLPPGARIGKPVLPDAPDIPLPSPEVLTPIAIQKRQELKKMRTMISKMEFMIEMAETEIYPGFTFNLSLTENKAVIQSGTMRMNEPFEVATSASMGEGLPKIPMTGLADAYLRETRQKLNSLKKQLEGAEAETAMTVREAWFRADRSKRESILYNIRVGGLSKLNLKSSLKSYESGIIPFSELMDSIMFLLETQINGEKKKSEIGKTTAILEETIGGGWNSP
jgi:outer membrane protein TolC